MEPSGPGEWHRPAREQDGCNTCTGGDTIPLGRRTLRVIAVHDDDADQAPVLVVEDTSGTATSEQVA